VKGETHIKLWIFQKHSALILREEVWMPFIALNLKGLDSSA
jgi:hypothetical protein